MDNSARLGPLGWGQQGRGGPRNSNEVLSLGAGSCADLQGLQQGRIGDHAVQGLKYNGQQRRIQQTHCLKHQLQCVAAPQVRTCRPCALSQCKQQVDHLRTSMAAADLSWVLPELCYAVGESRHGSEISMVTCIHEGQVWYHENSRHARNYDSWFILPCRTHG